MTTTETTAIYYRIQPVGRSLKHDSEDWAGNVMAGRLCAYRSVDSLLSGEGDDWHRADDWGDEGPREVVEFTGHDPRPLEADVPGISVRPGRVLRRTPLAQFLAKHGTSTERETMTYKIESKAGQQMGEYEGATAAEALAAMHRDAGYSTVRAEGDHVIFPDAETADICGDVDAWIVTEAH
jgi:hypothetical protein